MPTGITDRGWQMERGFKAVKLGYVPISKFVFSSEDARRYKSLVQERLKKWGVHFVHIDAITDDGMLYKKEDLPKVVEHLKREHVDALFCPHCNFGTEDVAALLRAVFTELDDPNAPTSEMSSGGRATTEMMVTTPDSTEELPGLLLSRGIPNMLGYMGMILIVDAPGLFQALNIHDVKLEPEEGGWRLRHGEKPLELSQRELVKLVFGPERYLDFAPEVFPVDFFQWILDRV